MSAYSEWAGVGDAEPWIPINEAFASLGQAFLWAERPAGHSALNAAYGGGVFDVNDVADGTVACADDALNYLVVHRTTRAVSASTATTDWDDTTTFGRMARVTFADGVITSWKDERLSPGGILGSSSPGGGGGSGNVDGGAADTNYGGTTAIDGGTA